MSTYGWPKVNSTERTNKVDMTEEVRRTTENAFGRVLDFMQSVRAETIEDIQEIGEDDPTAVRYAIVNGLMAVMQEMAEKGQRSLVPGFTTVCLAEAIYQLGMADLTALKSMQDDISKL